VLIYVRNCIICIEFVTNYSRDYSERMVIYTCKHEGACPCALRIERKAAARNSTA